MTTFTMHLTREVVTTIDADHASFDAGCAVFWNRGKGSDQTLVCAFAPGQWVSVDADAAKPQPKPSAKAATEA